MRKGYASEKVYALCFLNIFFLKLLPSQERNSWKKRLALPWGAFFTLIQSLQLSGTGAVDEIHPL